MIDMQDLHVTKQHSQGILYEIHADFLQLIDNYMNLQFPSGTVRAPYYINTSRRKDLRSLVGKGLPDEMVLETKVWTQAKKKSIAEMTPEQIRAFMTEIGIGIDCSGLVAHLYNEFLKNHVGKNLRQMLRFENRSMRARIARFLRMIENIGADDMSSQLNCDSITWQKVLPGDLIRGLGKQRNAYHVALITHVWKDSSGKVRKLRYINSHRKYGEDNGIRWGELIVTEPSEDFLAQKWTDVHRDGRNYFYEDISSHPQESGFKRFKFLG